MILKVPFARSSLNHDDVFILDTEKKIYQFNGASTNIQERAKALEVIQYLKDKYHEGTCDIAIIGENLLLLEDILYMYAYCIFLLTDFLLYKMAGNYKLTQILVNFGSFLVALHQLAKR